MKSLSRRLTHAAAGIAVVSLLGFPLAHGQAAPQGKGQLAEEVFKNIKVLKGIPVDDFMATMGVMSAAVGFDCSECHIGAGTEKVDWAFDTQKKVMARKMVTMMQTINKENFSGRQMVTCWSCHHGRDRPATTPQLETVYGPGSTEMDDRLIQMPGQPPAEQIIDKYIQAIGGMQRLSAIKSYVAKGSSIGFGGFGGGGEVRIYAKFPDQRTTSIVFKDTPDRGDSIRTYNGSAGWIMTPLAVLTEYPLTGGELDGARLDAQLSFPAQMKQVLTNLQVSLPTSISDLPGPSSQNVEGIRRGRVGTGPPCERGARKRPPRRFRDDVFRSAVGPSGAHGAVCSVAHRPRSDTGGLLGLSRRERSQNAIPPDLRLARRAGCDSVERDSDQRPHRRVDIRETGIEQGKVGLLNRSPT